MAGTKPMLTFAVAFGSVCIITVSTTLPVEDARGTVSRSTTGTYDVDWPNEAVTRLLTPPRSRHPAVEEFLQAARKLQSRGAAAIPPGPPPARLGLCADDTAFCGVAIMPLASAARAAVAPGRASCPRQAVPIRSRRRLRVWERGLV